LPNTRPVCTYGPRGQKLGTTDVQRDPNSLTDSLIWGTKWTNPTGGALVIPISIYASSSTSTGTYVPNAAEILAIKNSIKAYQQYINAQFVLGEPSTTFNPGIMFNISKSTVAGLLGNADMPGLLTYKGVPYSNISIMRGNYFSGVGSDLQIGSADFSTYLHEFGHALGLSHTHDTYRAGGLNSVSFAGVTAAIGGFGTFGLNQGVYTIMGYNNGWCLGPLGPSTSTAYGYQATPMALDILALQKLYGVNMTTNVGDTPYQLASTNGGFSCIWDAGGNDTIVGSATLSNNIDLRAATGLLEQGGGGWVSYVSGFQGGFTIAVGAVIENAVGGAFADVITGNAVANHITGGGGADTLKGGAGNDIFHYNLTSDSNFANTDLITDFLVGSDRLDFSAIDANTLFDGDQAFQLVSGNFTGAGQVRVVDNGTDTYVYANINSDLGADICLKLSGHHVLTQSDFIL
jgi:serralysin